MLVNKNVHPNKQLFFTVQLTEGVNKKNDGSALNFFPICYENEVKINKQTFCEGQKLEEITALSVMITVKVNESSYLA